ncbi:hypothetical protein GQ457_05G001920 [Hibiscus cannabinus]
MSDGNMRDASWVLLRQLNQTSTTPWLVAGDFNEIMYSNEKRGGRLRSARQMEQFRMVLSECNLYDLGFSGRWYTWERGRFLHNNVRERLDRGVANSQWNQSFPDYLVKHLRHSFSDHCPVLIDTTGKRQDFRHSPPLPFKFDAAWVMDDSCTTIIFEFWSSHTSDLPTKLCELGSSLKNWSLSMRKEKRAVKDSLEARLKELEEGDLDDDVLAELIDVKLGLNIEADKEELSWKQRARVNWLSHGDKNTTFFHNFAAARKKNNLIKEIGNGQGSIVSTTEEIACVAVDFFKDLFSASVTSDAETVLRNVRHCVTPIMNEFNVALLAKQGWRILSNHSSLLARVLKARYFPRTDFLSAQLGSTPSYTWRSIYSAKGLLEKGLGWRIGNGRDVSIWNDSWLLVKGDGRIRDHAIDIQYTRVVDLINPTSNEWNSALVKSIFTPSVAQQILCIPLAKTETDDMLVWRYEGNGHYTPKSGYRLLRDEASMEFRGIRIHGSNSFPEFFNLLWNLNLPSKCKIFLWRLFHNFIPNFTNLQQRRIQVQNACPFCEVAAESTAHFLYECSWSIQLLQALHIEFPDPSQFLDYRSWLSRFIINSDREKRVVIVITYWALWYARNQLVHEGIKQSIHKISAFVLAHVAELDIVAALSLSSLPSVPSRWSLPASGIIKINFDTSFLSSTKEAISGIVARDSTGLIMAACIIPHSDVNDAFVAEVKACESAVLFAIELGFKSVQVEGDSLTVIRKFSSGSLDKSIIQPIITDIKAKLHLFEKITFSHVGRQGNAAAHALARIHTQFQLPRYWVEEAPQEVEQITLADLR